MSQHLNKLSDLNHAELQELAYILTQVKMDEVKRMYWKLNLSPAETNIAIETALSAKEKMKEFFKSSKINSGERCPNCNSPDIHWKDEYHLGWHCKLCGSSFHRPNRQSR